MSARSPVASVVDRVQAYWSAFARAGDPNTPGTPSWPAYDRSGDAHEVLSEAVTTAAGLSADDCDFWDAIYARKQAAREAH